MMFTVMITNTIICVCVCERILKVQAVVALGCVFYFDVWQWVHPIGKTQADSAAVFSASLIDDSQLHSSVTTAC